MKFLRAFCLAAALVSEASASYLRGTKKDVIQRRRRDDLDAPASDARRLHMHATPLISHDMKNGQERTYEFEEISYPNHVSAEHLIPHEFKNDQLRMQEFEQLGFVPVQQEPPHDEKPDDGLRMKEFKSFVDKTASPPTKVDEKSFTKFDSMPQNTKETNMDKLKEKIMELSEAGMDALAKGIMPQKTNKKKVHKEAKAEDSPAKPLGRLKGDILDLQQAYEAAGGELPTASSSDAAPKKNKENKKGEPAAGDSPPPAGPGQGKNGPGKEPAESAETTSALDAANTVEFNLSTVAFEYELSEGEPNLPDYVELSKITATVLDELYQGFFEGISSVEYLSSLIQQYTVLGPRLVQFEISVYFNGDKDLPTQEQLEVVLQQGLEKDAEMYKTYLERLDESTLGAFRYTTSLRLILDKNELNRLRSEIEAESAGDSEGVPLKIILPVSIGGGALLLAILCIVFRKRRRPITVEEMNLMEAKYAARRRDSDSVSETYVSDYRTSVFSEDGIRRDKNAYQTFIRRAADERLDKELEKVMDDLEEISLEDVSTDDASLHSGSTGGAVKALPNKETKKKAAAEEIVIISPTTQVKVETADASEEGFEISDEEGFEVSEKEKEDDHRKEVTTPPSTKEPHGYPIVAAAMTAEKEIEPEGPNEEEIIEDDKSVTALADEDEAVSDEESSQKDVVSVSSRKPSVPVKDRIRQLEPKKSTIDERLEETRGAKTEVKSSAEPEFLKRKLRPVGASSPKAVAEAEKETALKAPEASSQEQAGDGADDKKAGAPQVVESVNQVQAQDNSDGKTVNEAATDSAPDTASFEEIEEEEEVVDDDDASTEYEIVEEEVSETSSEVVESSGQVEPEEKAADKDVSETTSEATETIRQKVDTKTKEEDEKAAEATSKRASKIPAESNEQVETDGNKVNKKTADESINDGRPAWMKVKLNSAAPKPQGTSTATKTTMTTTSSDSTPEWMRKFKEMGLQKEEEE